MACRNLFPNRSWNGARRLSLIWRNPMLKLDWGDAKVWMDLATELHTRNTADPQNRHRSGYPQMNELNVAAVCAGYAFELIYKVLVRVGGGQPESSHEPSRAHAKLAQTERTEVERIISSHGWENASELLKHLDEYLCDKNRKYWMRPPPPGSGIATGVFHSGGRKGMDALQKLHEDLSNLALKRIEENPDVHEDWPGTASIPASPVYLPSP